MDYNNGKIFNIKEYSNDEQIKMIHDFSEGSKQLEMFLLKLLSLGIETSSCCRGHDDNTPSYVSMVYDMSKIDEKDKTNSFFNQLYLMIQSDSEISLNITSHYEKVNIIVRTNYNRGDSLWENLSNLQLNKELINEEIRIATSLGKKLNDFDCYMNICKKSEQESLEICKNGRINGNREITDKLDNINKKLEEEKTFSTGIFSCNPDSLSKFTFLLYYLFEKSSHSNSPKKI